MYSIGERRFVLLYFMIIQVNGPACTNLEGVHGNKPKPFYENLVIITGASSGIGIDTLINNDGCSVNASFEEIQDISLKQKSAHCSEADLGDRVDRSTSVIGVTGWSPPRVGSE